MRETKRNPLMATTLAKIASLSGRERRMKFGHLMSHFTRENLISCFHELDRRKAVGVDGKTKDDYAKNLVENVDSLIARMKQMSYRPMPVREVLIPKGDGKLRPLGISTIEDKMVQSMFGKILESVYEPLFCDESHGFRRGRSCHGAIRALNETLYGKSTEVVIDVDLQNFFGSIDHKKLMALLRLKIGDETFLRYIVRMLKSGILSEGALKMSDEGTPQGSIVSPILANVYAHYAIDIWHEDAVKGHTGNRSHLVRYADDLVICCRRADAPRILKSLEGRLERFSLVMNQEKTKVVEFDKKASAAGDRQGSFDFLGFTFYMGMSRKGRPLAKLKTSGKRMRAKLKAVSQWCKGSRHQGKLLAIWRKFAIKIGGHIRYYGVSHNSESVAKFVHQAKGTFFKWMNRRSQRKSLNWDEFSLFVKKYPLPDVKIYHRLF